MVYEDILQWTIQSGKISALIKPTVQDINTTQKNKHPCVRKLSKYLSTIEATVQDGDWNPLPRWEKEPYTTPFQVAYVTETIKFGHKHKTGKETKFS